MIEFETKRIRIKNKIEVDSSLRVNLCGTEFYGFENFVLPLAYKSLSFILIGRLDPNIKLKYIKNGISSIRYLRMLITSICILNTYIPIDLGSLG